MPEDQAVNLPIVERRVDHPSRHVEDLALFAEAATFYELFQRRYPKSKQAAGLIYNAGVFRENLGDTKRAIRDYRIYVGNYPGKPDMWPPSLLLPCSMKSPRRGSRRLKNTKGWLQKWRELLSLF